MGTKWVQTQYVGGIFWVQTQFIGGYILGTNTKCRHQKKNFETFEMSGFARPTFVKGGKFPLCSQLMIWVQIKILVF